MDKQVVFEQIVHHLFAQGERCMNRGYCVYQNEDGLKCSIGRLMQPYEYDKKMEGVPLRFLTRRGFALEILENADETDMEFLAHMQSVHDEEENWESSKAMRATLRIAAQKFNLDAAFIKKLSFVNR